LDFRVQPKTVHRLRLHLAGIDRPFTEAMLENMESEALAGCNLNFELTL
jgi:hypothetical protein